MSSVAARIPAAAPAHLADAVGESGGVDAGGAELERCPERVADG
ncbi:hypothetical protein M877_33855 [Streptomyces niveus NCIMB 11891]|nr:hypothetical protein M877_33855 [Streptomyces niveus NCIMB 11891]